MARRYAADRSPPSLRDVEAALWHAGEVADRRFGGYSPRRSFSLITSNIEHWTSENLGWSFPCAEAVTLIRRLVDWPCGRIIDIGAGAGLWTRLLKCQFGADKVIGLDPHPTGDHIVKATFGEWCEMTGGPANTDLLFRPGCPAEANRVAILALRYSTRSPAKSRCSHTSAPGRTALSGLASSTIVLRPGSKSTRPSRFQGATPASSREISSGRIGPKP